MLSGETAYVFRHALLRDAAYQLQPLTLRAALHRAAADVMEQAFGPGDDRLAPVAHELADHLALAIQGMPDAAADLGRRELRYLRLAARYAHKQTDFVTAEAFWRRALGRGESADDELETRLDLSGVLHELGRGRQSDEMLQSALELEPRAHLPALRARALLQAAARPGATDASGLDRALELARESGDAVLIGGILYLQGDRLATAANTDQALARLDQAMAAYASAGNRTGQARVLASRARVFAYALKQPDQAAELLQQAVALAEGASDRVAAAEMSLNLGVHHANFGQSGLAEPAYRRALELLAGTGAHFLAMRAQTNLGMIYLFMLDRVRDAGAIWAQSLELVREHGRETDIVTGLNNLGRWMCSVGRWAEAETLLRESLTRCDKSGWPAEREADWIIARTYLAIALHEQGRLDEALPLLQDAVPRVASWNHQNAWLLGREYAWLLFRLAQLERARTAMNQVLAHMRQGYNYDNRFVAAGVDAAMHQLCGDDAAARAAIEPWHALTGRWRVHAWLLPNLRLLAASGGEGAGLARGLVLEMQQLAARGDSMELATTRRALETAQRLGDDIASSAPRTWRGHFADELPAPCRRALLARLTPQQAADFRVTRPAAWAAWSV
ncbi:MAG: tetratricopeptide repeat protein [Planctomycetes bacterium]|jgi:tetratricopeptide (TPR) repeat protein|nr:tetratricopeptide repeat protein [Planctomycetota bacterium]MCL4729063.1 tetratricopeptide repeat protein [Planctomycetota bacterium]